MIDFLQLNLHKSAQATLLAGQTMEQTASRVLLLTEMHTIRNKLHSFPRGTTAVYDRSIPHHHPGPRAAIVSTRDIQLTALEQWCHRDCAAALAKVDGHHILLISAYLDINFPVRTAWLDNILNMAHTKSYPVLMAMDSNAHSSLFGPSNNARGDDLEDLILRHNLLVENVGDVPTFETRRGNNMIQTFVDVTLSRDLPSPILRWHVDRSYNASDHNNIIFQYKSTTPPKEKIRPWSKANWPLFTETLARAKYDLPQIMSMKKLDKTVQRAYDLIKLALDKACPLIAVAQKTKGSHWATEEHAHIKTSVTKLYKKAKASNLESDWLAYRTANKDFKRQCNRDKNRAWRHYKESIQTTKDTANLVKLAQRQDRSDINVLTRPDGSSTDPGKETVDLLTQTHFPSATGTRRVPYNNRRISTLLSSKTNTGLG